MSSPTKLFAGAVCAALLLCAAPGCTSAIEVTAIAPSSPIRIDGKADDWQGHLLYYRDVKLTVGVSNDRDFVYLCLMSSDQSVYRSILLRGITVWFDTTAGKGRYFGIRYPLEMNEGELPQSREEQPSATRDDLMKRRADNATKLAVLGAKKDNRTEILLPGRHGIDARIGYTPGVFVYEMKIPLGIDLADGLKLAFSPDHHLSIRLETPEDEGRSPAMHEPPPGGMSEGGMNDGGIAGETPDGSRGQRRGGGGGRRAQGAGPADASHRMPSIDLLMNVEQARPTP